MSTPSVHVKVREIASALGLPFELRANNTLVKSNISPDAVTVLVEFLVTNETTREVRFMRRGRRLMVWEASPDGKVGRSGLVADDGDWMQWKYSEIVMWDDTFKPYIEHKIGRIETPAEYRDRRRWEGDQYRVGSSRTPMDSAYRVTLGHTTDAMTDYWNR